MSDVNGLVVNYRLEKQFYSTNIGEKCVILIGAIDAEDIDVILGNVFMRKYVSYFSHDKN